MNRNRKRRLLVVSGLTAFVGAVGVAVVLHVSAPARVLTTRANLSDPTLALAEAQAASPFPIKQPGYLPVGASLENVTWIVPDAEAGPAFSVDLWYALPDGTRLHVWETNNQDLIQTGKDPAAPTAGTPVEIAGVTWRIVRLLPDSTTVLSAHLADGITVTVNAILDDPTLEQVAASID